MEVEKIALEPQEGGNQDTLKDDQKSTASNDTSKAQDNGYLSVL